MLTVLMETHDHEAELAQTLSVLVSGAVEGLISDVLILDHGSRDASRDVADAAGCRFYESWSMDDLLSSARGDWLLFIEAGARPLSGWVEEVSEYTATAAGPARFSPSRNHRPHLLRCLFRPAPPLEHGFLISKRDCTAIAKDGMSLAQIARKGRTRRLRSQLVPASVLRQGTK